MNMGKTAASIIITAMVVMAVFSAICTPASAATEPAIEQAIVNGTAYLASVQNLDGSWGVSDKPARTAFVLMKLEDRAIELGLDPFDNDTASPTYYVYADNVTDGMNYLCSQAHTTNIGLQTHGDPDSNSNGQGIYFGTGHQTYTTGLALCALSLSDHPDDRTYNIGGTDYTYKEIAQDATDWMAFAQTDSGIRRGGWDYDGENNGSSPSTDNSNSGYAVLGLAYAEEFGCTVPQWVKDELNLWIDYIQNDVNGDTDDGGSGYRISTNWVNILKTGNLLQQMAFYGDDSTVPRVQNAIDYLERHWRDANRDPGWGYSLSPPSSVPEYQAMFTTMKGLQAIGVDLIDTDGDTVADDDWFNQESPVVPPEDFASVLVMQQNADGSWPQCGWDYESNRILSTAWALLTLEKIAPTRTLDINKTDDVADGDCVDPGDTITYTICYGNPNTRTVHNVVIVDHLDYNTTFVSATGGGSYDAVNHTVAWVIGDLAAEATGCVTLNVTVNASTGGITLENCAKINGDEVDQVGVCEHTNVCYQPLNITKTDDAEGCVDTRTFSYTICYDNQQNMVAVHNVTITDTLPGDVRFLSAPDGGIYDASTHTVIWDIGTVQAGATSCVTMRVLVEAGVAGGTILENCAAIESDETEPRGVCIDTVVCEPYPTPIYSSGYKSVPALTSLGMILLIGVLLVVGSVTLRRKR